MPGSTEVAEGGSEDSFDKEYTEPPLTFAAIGTNPYYERDRHIADDER
jgi:hypothetical protein